MRAALLALCLLATPALADPSFDCAKAKGDVETTICNEDNADLALKDSVLDRLFQALKKQGGHAVTLAAQPSWLKTRDACGSDVDCLTKAYDSRLVELAHEAGDTTRVTGNYHSSLSGGQDAGDAFVVREDDGTLTGYISSVTGTEQNTCDIAFEGANPIGDAFVWDDPETTGSDDDFCRILFRPAKGALRIDSDTCQTYCGANASFDGSYSSVQ